MNTDVQSMVDKVILLLSLLEMVTKTRSILPLNACPTLIVGKTSKLPSTLPTCMR